MPAVLIVLTEVDDPHQLAAEIQAAVTLLTAGQVAEVTAPASETVEAPGALPRRPPFGFRRVDGVLVPMEPEASALRTLYQLEDQHLHARAIDLGRMLVRAHPWLADLWTARSKWGERASALLAHRDELEHLL